MRRRIGWSPALAAALALLPGTPAAAAEPVKVAEYKPDSGFIDDPIAFSDDGGTLAYITTDGATASQLHFVAPGGKAAPVACKYPSITPERIDFLDGERVLVVERNPDTRVATAQVFTRGCAAREKLGPASEIALGRVGGVPAIVTWLRSEKGGAGGSATHTLAAFRRDDGKPLGRRVLPEDADGRVTVAGKRMKPLFFAAGFAELIAQKEGDYDAKHDIRRPDVAARVDVFAGKVLAEHEIPDLIAWTQLAQLRRKHQNESEFVQFSEDLKQLQLVDRDDATVELRTARPLRKYDPTTLAWQPLGDGALAVSLTVDPVNPDAVAAQKADQDWLDVYRLDVRARTLTEIARIDGQKRPQSWRLAGLSRIGVLRKHKGFARGGVELEVFDLGTRQAAAAPTALPPPAAPTAPTSPAPARR
jgi:hypothetical protein